MLISAFIKPWNGIDLKVKVRLNRLGLNEIEKFLMPVLAKNDHEQLKIVNLSHHVDPITV